MIDFGTQFFSANRWLEIGVRTNGNETFTTLTPRQPVTPAPYAIYALTAASATTASTATNVTGTVTPSQLPAGTVIVTNNYPDYLNLARVSNGGLVGVTNLDLATSYSSSVNHVAVLGYLRQPAIIVTCREKHGFRNSQ